MAFQSNDEVDAYSDDVVALDYLQSHPQDNILPSFLLDSLYDCDMSEEYLHGPSLSSPHNGTLSSCTSEDSSDLLDLDEDENMQDFSGLFLPGYPANNHVLINDASADSDLDYPLISHCGRSPDFDPSQEKSYHSFMGTGSPLNLPCTTLDPSDFEHGDDLPSPFYGCEPDCTNGLDFNFASDFNMPHTDAHSMDLLDSGIPSDLQLDYDLDDHEIMQTIPFEHEPNSGALTSGKARTKARPYLCERGFFF